MHPNLRFLLFFFCLISSLAWSQPGCSNPQHYYFDIDMDGYGSKNYDQGDEYQLYEDFISKNVEHFIIYTYTAFGC